MTIVYSFHFQISPYTHTMTDKGILFYFCKCCSTAANVSTENAIVTSSVQAQFTLLLLSDIPLK